MTVSYRRCTSEGASVIGAPLERLGASHRDTVETVMPARYAKSVNVADPSEIAARFAKAYARASKAGKGRILDQIVEATGWSRDNARRRLTAAGSSRKTRRPAAKHTRRQRKAKYSCDAIKVLEKVRMASDGQCGRYLAASMALQLDALERHGELVYGQGHYSRQVRAELLSMSSATIDRYLRPIRATGQSDSESGTHALSLVRSSVKIRKAVGVVEAAPGFFRCDTTSHRGPIRKGDRSCTLKLTDAHIGWVFIRTVGGSTHTHILDALRTAMYEVPYELTGLDFDSGSEIGNKAVAAWAAQMGIIVTRPRRYRRAGQTMVESGNEQLASLYGFGYRSGTDDERAVINRLWQLVGDQLNYLTPNIKAVGYRCGRDGRRRRIYDAPTTPLDRLLAARVLSPAQESELLAYRDGLNPAAITRHIADLRAVLAATPTSVPEV